MENSYKSAGVDIDKANKMKTEFKGFVGTSKMGICTPINRVGAFASLVDVDLTPFNNPIFVLKTEEPGSKQLLSIDNDMVEWIAEDLINHLVNDIIVMGAVPCAVLDTIICGHLDDSIILRLVRSISNACQRNQCVLVGGETSEQPGVLANGQYVLQASIMGVVDRANIVDGSKIKKDDLIFSISSNGIHTNGYTLVRDIIRKNPRIIDEKLGDESFLDSILKPHKAYNNFIMKIRDQVDLLHGMAHITGGGIHDNLARILPENLSAEIDLSAINVLQIFSLLKEYGNISEKDMLETFNVGVGMILVVDPVMKSMLDNHSLLSEYEINEIGMILDGNKQVKMMNSLKW